MPTRGRWVPAVLALLLCVVMALPARAQSIIRDPDIEHAMARLARPLILAAGLSPSRIRIILINDSKLNAFIIDDAHVFLNTGLVLRMGSAGELQAVIAHELAHIANGHVTRRAGNARAANRTAGLAIGLALAAGAAAGSGELAGGLGFGLSSAVNRNFLAHTRTEEAAADASALRYLESAGVDPQSMADVLDIFRGQEALSAGRQDPYARSHPLTSDRIRNVKAHAAAKGGAPPDPGAAYWFARAQGKLSAFLRNPNWTLRRVDRGDTSDVALIRRAVAYHKNSDAKRARAEIDRLAARRPDDPYVHELRGQILFESRDTGGGIQAYRRAANLAPRNGLILASYGRALLAPDTAASNAEALRVLISARAREPGNPRMLRDLAVAHARAGQTGLASLRTAERFVVLGRWDDAKVHATRASGLLPRGGPGWQQAADILDAAERQTQGRKRG